MSRRVASSSPRRMRTVARWALRVQKALHSRFRRPLSPGRPEGVTWPGIACAVHVMANSCCLAADDGAGCCGCISTAGGGGERRLVRGVVRRRLAPEQGEDKVTDDLRALGAGAPYQRLDLFRGDVLVGVGVVGEHLRIP